MAARGLLGGRNASARSRRQADAASDFALLNPPATRDDIQQAELLLGTPLPGDLAESLQCHNGVSA
ncbi:hypothetical protein GCM10014713_65100 [Streptomyces purpureus]|uniref:Uncharacterized protein n=1 Tax=Streptomyces purpureus TaxID=1951 RepID=A0A918LWK4_9ACTN|nr:hypothetical protein GCM10014713_65100 [Streptomyces purpureus]